MVKRFLEWLNEKPTAFDFDNIATLEDFGVVLWKSVSAFLFFLGLPIIFSTMFIKSEYTGSDAGNIGGIVVIGIYWTLLYYIYQSNKNS